MSNSAADVRQHSARVRAYVTMLWIVSLTLVVLERFSAVAIKAFQSGFASDAVRAFACQAIAAFPEGLLLLGLWWVREALAAFARGELFSAALTRMLDRVGLVLIVGAAIRIFIVPGLCRVLGSAIDYWIAYDAAAMVLFAIGLAFKAIAGVLRHAATIQSELDEIF